MNRMIFPNLPVSDLKKAENFYLGLGFTKNPQFSSDDCTAVVVSDEIVIMLLRRDFYEGFLPEGGSAHLGSSAKEVLNCLSCSSPEEVDGFVAKTETGGGSVYVPAKEYMPGMYGASIADPDGHVWEMLWMSPEAAAGQGAEPEAEQAEAGSQGVL